MIVDAIRARIREVERQPESRLKTVRLIGLRVLLEKRLKGR